MTDSFVGDSDATPRFRRARDGRTGVTTGLARSETIRGDHRDGLNLLRGIPSDRFRPLDDPDAPPLLSKL